MDIVEFFQLSVGKWFSQRTSHQFALQKQENGKSELVIEAIDRLSSSVVQSCEQAQIDPQLALCAVKITWTGSVEQTAKQQTGGTLLVAIANSSDPQTGKLLKSAGAGQAPAIGRYIMSRNDELTLVIENDTLYSEERLWFESPNVRLRHSILKQASGFSTAAFCSEIRMGVTKSSQPSSPPTI
ncbi:MAG: phycobiliprotein lyase [Scytolyngbya sp. HA4215-MV1]|jgi:hypothetical protein|nr:phycobiliprotein lyase [Scytolyngbya sp. HA4215-MV1]